ncbi:SRPBCC family protein [Rhizobiaceae bacterium n13]|uniref:SRPBCC family protein n=1 Tax=Ferirhizobium litorale TaxID=2927786 RepID=A0AAE3QHM7_9HYPH|nr:SRPBCC family protein [Fererhizobium litorale]MDI7863553.1 SRPBCC family protein [Fererhizobium litorale]MDI7923526.1 SRPBCC family protein [Fererhizobium litorale]
MATMQSRIVHVRIERNWKLVYDFASRPENMPLWASGLGDGFRRDGDEWIATGPLGSVRVRFAPRNEFGVIDHEVTMETGLKVHNALRVVPNGDGAEVMFTLLKVPDMTDASFAADEANVRKDLETLKALMEFEGASRS